MKKIVLEGKYLLDREIAHEYLKKALDFPEYYGKNLDALYDCLTDLGETVIEIKMPKVQMIEEEKRIYFNKIQHVFKMAAKENDVLKVSMI